jgi:hypothetical protein
MVAMENADATFSTPIVCPSFCSGQKKISRGARAERRDLAQSVQYERFLEASRAFWTQYRHQASLRFSWDWRAGKNGHCGLMTASDEIGILADHSEGQAIS